MELNVQPYLSHIFACATLVADMAVAIKDAGDWAAHDKRYADDSLRERFLPTAISQAASMFQQT